MQNGACACNSEFVCRALIKEMRLENGFGVHGGFFRGFFHFDSERCKGVHCVDLGESFPTRIYLQKSASIQPRTSPSKFGGNIQYYSIVSLEPIRPLMLDLPLFVTKKPSSKLLVRYERSLLRRY